MSQKIKFLLGIFAFSILMSGTSLHAQTSMDLNTIGSVDVKSLNDKQIQSLMQQASAQGLSVDQAIQIAKARGASQAQIDDLMKRVNGSKKMTSGTGIGATNKSEFSEVMYDYAKDYSQKEDIVLSEKLKRIFGHQLFNSKQLSFEPSLNIPLSNDYILGVNDELTIIRS